MKRAQILLAADKGQKDDAISETLNTALSSIHRTRQKFVEGGVEFALSERPRPGGQKKLDSKAEALLVAIAYSEPPVERAKWTMQLLAECMVELKVTESLSDETVRRTLQKRLKPWLKEQWCFPTVGADLSGGWRIFSTCMLSPTTQTDLLFASMKDLVS